MPLPKLHSKFLRFLISFGSNAMSDVFERNFARFNLSSYNNKYVNTTSFVTTYFDLYSVG